MSATMRAKRWYSSALEASMSWYSSEERAWLSVTWVCVIRLLMGVRSS